MAWSATPRSIEYDDDQKLDRMVGMAGPSMPEPPDYPPGCCFTVGANDLKKAGLDDGKLGDTAHFAAMATVTSVMVDPKYCRIECEITQLAGEDGKFVDLENPAHFSLERSELEKLDLSEDAERGDMLHMIGTVRLDGYHDHEYSDGKMHRLQIVEMCCVEDESAESRAGSREG